MDQAPDLNQLSDQQVRQLAAQLLVEVAQKDQTIQRVQLQNEQYKHELALLKRHRFARKSEALNTHQRSLLDDLVDEDLAGIEEEMARQSTPKHRAESKQHPRRRPLPPELPRTVIEHEPENTVCSCVCQMTRIGEDISEKLDRSAPVRSMSCCLITGCRKVTCNLRTLTLRERTRLLFSGRAGIPLAGLLLI